MKLGRTARIVLIVAAFIFAFFIVNQMKGEAESQQHSLDMQLEVTQLVLPKLAADKEALGEQLVLLESDLALAAASLEESRAEFPADIQSIEYDEILFNIAHQWDLDIISLTASEPSSRSVEVTIEPADPEAESVTYTITYTVTSFNITVEGKPVEPTPEEVEEFRAYLYQTVADILSYFNSIATGEDFTTATVESVNIAIPEPCTGQSAGITIPACAALELTGLEEAEEEETEAVTAEEEVVEEETELLEAMPATATINLLIYSYEGDE